MKFLVTLSRRLAKFRGRPCWFDEQIDLAKREAVSGLVPDALPPATDVWCSGFTTGEVVPMKGIRFAVGRISNDGLFLIPIGLTGSTRRKAKAAIEERKKAIADAIEAK